MRAQKVKLTRQQMRRARGETFSRLWFFSGKKKLKLLLCSFPSELSPLRALIMALVIVFKWDCTHTKLQSRLLQSCKPIQNCFSPLLLLVSCFSLCSSERLAMINYLNICWKKRSLSMTIHRQTHRDLKR